MINYFFILAFVLFSHNVSLAQERGNARNSEMEVLIESAEIKTAEGRMKEITIFLLPENTLCVS